MINLINRLYHIPHIYLFFLLSFIAILISIFAVTLVHYFVPGKLRHKDNPVIGNISSLISIIYGVLVGLTALYLINNISYTSNAVQNEANAIADIYRDSKWLREPARTGIHIQVKKYLNYIINIEWPMMEKGDEVSSDGTLLIENITNELVNYQAAKNSETLLVHDMIDEIKTLYDAREQRIHMNYSSINWEMWIVILIGTILTIMINYLFDMNYYLHVLTVGAVALMASSMIFLLVTLDRPFQGEFGIDPDPFKSVLTYIEKNSETYRKQME